ncbi:hypothetical protein BVX98_02445, partial [bacterium F11]
MVKSKFIQFLTNELGKPSRNYGNFITITKTSILPTIVITLFLMTAQAGLAINAAAVDTKDLGHTTETMWAPYLEWSITNPSYSGNPFDVVATVTFTHDTDPEPITTEMFYNGGGARKIRFSAARTGEWWG